MTRTDFIARFKASLRPDTAALFFTADDPAGLASFSRHLDAALMDYSRYRPRRLLGSVTLSDSVDYSSPADLLWVMEVLWGQSGRKSYGPYDAACPPVVVFTRHEDDRGTRLRLAEAVSAYHRGLYGANCEFFYAALHVMTETVSTVSAADEDVLLLRCQAEAMSELAIRNHAKPVELRQGRFQMSSNGTPAGLRDAYMAAFEKRVRP